MASSNFIDYRTDGETRRTQWTLVFNQDALTAELYRCEDWQNPYSLKLREDQWR